MNWENGTFVRGYAKHGILIGTVRHFSKTGQLTSITDGLTSNTYLTLLNDVTFKYYQILNPTIELTETSPRKLITKSMEEIFNCLQVDAKLFVKCFKIDSNIFQMKGCKIEWNSHQLEIPKETIQILIDPWGEMTFHSETKIPPHCIESSNLSIHFSIENWVNLIGDRNMFWHQFTTSFEPIDPKNPQIDVIIYDLRNRPGYNENVTATIRTLHGYKLFEGPLINGRLTGKVDHQLVNHPGWKTRLNIQIGTEYFVRGKLKNGKLHGIVQNYGILSRNHEGRCSNIITPGLSFVGYFENGSPTGPCWRRLIGGSWLYGNLGENHEFTGTNIAYLHQDLQLAMVGQFRDGMMVCTMYNKSGRSLEGGRGAIFEIFQKI